ncbi:MAG: hypothetical protein CVT94_16975 [Bacteroidetes bacterium HGW-Bacteroidetes-11]|nr:MAG: hypothetical protein CVT94_16975 [Bacteroidetes bacterium HGW-Bacteroidetes-11]
MLGLLVFIEAKKADGKSVVIHLIPRHKSATGQAALRAPSQGEGPANRRLGRKIGEKRPITAARR